MKKYKISYLMESFGFAWIVVMVMNTLNTEYDTKFFLLAYLSLQVLFTGKARFLYGAVMFYAAKLAIIHGFFNDKGLLIILALFSLLVIYNIGPEFEHMLQPKEYSIRKNGGLVIAIANLILAIYISLFYPLSPDIIAYFVGESAAILSILLIAVRKQIDNKEVETPMH